MANGDIFITLGSGNEFGISGHRLFIRSTNHEHYELPTILDLGPPTKENFRSLTKTMERLECHMEEE
jgi:hypothetical protein